MPISTNYYTYTIGHMDVNFYVYFGIARFCSQCLHEKRLKAKGPTDILNVLLLLINFQQERLTK